MSDLDEIGAIREEIRSSWAETLCRANWSQGQLQGFSARRVPSGTNDGTGDAMLWHALLYYSGETWAGEALEGSMDAAGGLWRSPIRRLGGGNPKGRLRFSFDHALGFLLYLACLSIRDQAEHARELGRRWCDWLELNLSGPKLAPSFSLCEWDTDTADQADSCAMDGPFGGRGALVAAVLRHLQVPLPTKSGLFGIGKVRLGEGSEVNRYFLELEIAPGSFHSHLAGVASVRYSPFIGQKIGGLSFDRGSSSGVAA